MPGGLELYGDVTCDLDDGAVVGDALEADVVSQTLELDAGRVTLNGPGSVQQLELLACLQVSGHNRMQGTELLENQHPLLDVSVSVNCHLAGKKMLGGRKKKQTKKPPR